MAGLGACSFGPSIVVFGFAPLLREAGASGVAGHFDMVMEELPLAYAGATSVIGAVIGAALGALASCAVSRRSVRRLPVAVVLVAAAMIGAGWGRATAGLLDLGAEPDCGCEYARLKLSTAVITLVGAVQLAWFLVPCACRLARRQSVWPLLIGACGFAALFAYLCSWYLG